MSQVPPKMIETLEKNVISQIRSSLNIDSITQCVLELVFNSLDAKAKAVAIRVNLSKFRIQVVDDGKGISPKNLHNVGLPYMTNKCHTLSDLNTRLKYFGFRGEALASIAKISSKVTVMSRERHSDETYAKVIEGDDCEVTKADPRPCFGTTVTVEGFLNNLPVRQQCVKSSEFEQIKRKLESLIIINPHVSFTLRNDASEKILMHSLKSEDVPTSFKGIHPEVNVERFSIIKCEKGKISVEGLINKEFRQDKKLQYVYVNKRPVTCPQLEAIIGTQFRKVLKPMQAISNPKDKHPIFVIHIKCPYSDVDFSLEASKTVVFLKKFDLVRSCLERIIGTFGGVKKVPDDPQPPKKPKSDFGASQIGGAVKAVAFKRPSTAGVSDKTKANKMKFSLDDESNDFKTGQQKNKVSPIAEASGTDGNYVADCTLFTNFPENEVSGKNIIMDMFIKSVQVFPSESSDNEAGDLHESMNVGVVESPCVVGGHNSFSKQPDRPKVEMVSIGIQVDDNFSAKPQDFAIPSLDIRAHHKKNSLSHPPTKSPFFKNPTTFKFNPSFEENLTQSPPKDLFHSQPFARDLNETVSSFFPTNRSKSQQTPFRIEPKLDESISKFFRADESQDLFAAQEPINDTESDWAKEVTCFGVPIYVNKKTGFRTFNSPKSDLNFDVIDRNRFVPKGLSPILKDPARNVLPMTPESKEKFQTAVLESYEDDLLIVKWRNCMGNKDPKTFFDEIYRDKVKELDPELPSVYNRSVIGNALRTLQGMSFTRDLFGNLDLIGQFDRKFIAVVEKSKKLIMLFDQHAVHERVRVEFLMEGFKDSSVKLSQTVSLFLPQEDLGLVRSHVDKFKALGLSLELFNDGVAIKGVPLCVYNKSKKGVNLVNLVQVLIKEIIDILKANNGILVQTPWVIQNIINSEACRGAIMFGDELTRDECFVHLKNLAECNLPFQCAHGRPTLTPVVFLEETFILQGCDTAKPNLRRLLLAK